MAETIQDYGTIIGADATFKGEITFEAPAKLLGKFEGSVTAKGKFHVADGSRCKATVKAKEVVAEGHIEGNVEAMDRVELKPKGSITGDITAARMNMADGASIDGHCRIGVNASAGRNAPGSTAEVKPAGQPQAVAVKK
jgi:cytoskeletal protein CcmA (bactofilin family)